MPREVTIDQGDTLIRIAKAHGFGSWELIWDFQGNEPLHQLRSDPQVLFKGDKVVIPDKNLKVVPCAASASHRFRARTLRCFLRICLKDQWGEAYNNERYEFTAGKRVWKGRTDADGIVSVAVPPDISDGSLKLWPDPDNTEACIICPVKVGHLDPVTEISGVQGRLNNLGFSCGDENGTIGEKTTRAIRFFQLCIDHENPTGELDEQTRQTLVDRHGNI